MTSRLLARVLAIRGSRREGDKNRQLCIGEKKAELYHINTQKLHAFHASCFGVSLK